MGVEWPLLEGVADDVTHALVEFTDNFWSTVAH
jgi:hypothetical protein